LIYPAVAVVVAVVVVDVVVVVVGLPLPPWPGSEIMKVEYRRLLG